MSDLIAVAHDDRQTAERVRDEPARLTREHGGAALLSAPAGSAGPTAP